jgi:superfamily II DNA or RNA helicase
MELRPYQLECVHEAEAALAKHESALIVMPTGSGKTPTLASVGMRWPTGRVLVLAHREELIVQAANKIQQMTGERPDIEMGESRASPTLFGGSKFVVASVASLYREKRLTGDVYRPDLFGLVITDEAHHDSAGNVMYTTIRNHFSRNPNCRFLGVTATPDRGDKKPLGHRYAAVAYRYCLADAITDGWLVPIRQQFLTCQRLDFGVLKKGVGGDFTSTSAADMLMGSDDLKEEERPIHEVVSSAVQAAGTRPTLFFAPKIAVAERMAEIINRAGFRSLHPAAGRAVAVHGGNADCPMSPDERRRRLSAYHDGEYQYLIGCDVFYEGFDEPRISAVAIARATKSRSRYAQAVGRGTRILPDVQLDQHDAASRARAIAASGKPDLLVLDFVGASTSLKLDLASTADILSGEASAEAVRRAKQRAKKAAGPVDMAVLVAGAEKEILAERERAKRKHVVARAEYQSVNVDPFGFGGGVQSGGAGVSAGPNAATERQRAWLESQGLWKDGMSKAEAGRQITDAKKRFQHGLATPKQAQLLAKYGESTKVNKDMASAIIDVIAARGWRRRDYRLSRERWTIRQRADGFSPVVNDPAVGKIVIAPKLRFRTEESCREFIKRCVEDQHPVAAPAA